MRGWDAVAAYALSLTESAAWDQTLVAQRKGYGDRP
ncbi:hypothetical protein C8J26_1127 [Sphingomonas aurantiaca]|jgi:hypothetical protein|uniref:Uncharacterized protein n=1 Tax=Sphingomonas aurantiaca TaxID=185949 RepID=A0A2T5GND4_9SPHN|nr:hypothetical protein C8J26_1127 [Sphingomonas aurantiaca]